MSGKFAKSLSARTLKAMSVFGGVQSLTILCSVIRTKLVAVWIGPVAVGLLAIYNSAMDMLTNIGQLNLRQSAVRDISAATESDRPAVICATRRLGLILGLMGMVIVALGSPLMGLAAFGDTARWQGFAVLSVMMLCQAVVASEQSIMQGTGRLRNLAQANLWGNIAATAVAIPLFYYFRLRAVVPVILTYSVLNTASTLILREKGPRMSMPLRTLWLRSRNILSLGFWLTAASGVALLASFAFIAWLNREGGEDTVGQYQAGFTLVNTYVGIILTAIAMEYYPRLSAAVEKGMKRVRTLVAHETTICLWILIPLLSAFVSCAHIVVALLYSANFDGVLPYIVIAAGGTLFRAVSWCLAYTILARGDGRTFILTEASSAAIGFILNIVGYKLGGWAGLGAAYVLWYAAYTAITYAIFRYRYGQRLPAVVWQILATGVVVVGASLVLRTYVAWWLPAVTLVPATSWMALRRIVSRK